MIATTFDYKKLFGLILDNDNIIAARCACVSCNSCTCACSCRKSQENSIEW
ncbi:putative cysteine-rich protein (plasmid) [Campylobacter sp. RM16187]|nr:FibroRumin family radical SAM-modified Cys-rich RiPP [Campylobacter sp. RM16187]QKG30324.1 putative cysteine-rich protein [Campylobacter sp. RM16187]